VIVACQPEKNKQEYKARKMEYAQRTLRVFHFAGFSSREEEI
jgi:hypothetical protein